MTLGIIAERLAGEPQYRRMAPLNAPAGPAVAILEDRIPVFVNSGGAAERRNP